MNKQETAKYIKDLHRKWKEAFYQDAEKSRLDKMQSLNPYEPVPPTGYLYGDAAKNTFKEKSTIYRRAALEALEDWRKDVARMKAAAPSEEALRTITAFKLINPEGMTKEQYREEVQNLVDTFGDNYMINQALVSMANSAGVMVSSHPLAAEAENFEDVERNINNAFDGFSAALDAPNGGIEAVNSEGFFDMMIDQALSGD